MIHKGVAAFPARTGSQSGEKMCHLTGMEAAPKNTEPVAWFSTFTELLLKEISLVVEW